MHVLIPAGGKGARLRPLTDEHPKPLLPLGDRPILSHIVGSIPRTSPITVIVTAGLEPQFHAWREEHHPDRDLRIFTETPPAHGTAAGPVSALAECVGALGLREDVLVMMGDSVHPFRWGDFLHSCRPDRAQIAAYELPQIADARRFGVVEFTPDGRLTRFDEKPEHPRSRWIFTGCLHLPAALLTRLPEIAARRLPQMGQLVGAYLESGERVTVFQLSGEWNDIGTFQSYLRAHRGSMPEPELDRLRAAGNRLEGVVYVHPSAHISGSMLRNCVISGNSVIRNAELTNCVIRPNTIIANRVIHSTLVSSSGEHHVVQGERR
jgi:NDP-sugar pyrophosphorylase family protein